MAKDTAVRKAPAQKGRNVKRLKAKPKPSIFNAYWRLMRFDKPIGTLLLLWPTLWALWLAAEGTPSWRVLAIFTAAVIVMRAAGCVINDYADRKVDAHVARTKMRPHGPSSPIPMPFVPIWRERQRLLAGRSDRSGRCPSRVCMTG